MEPSNKLRSMNPSRMRRETYIHVSCGEVLKVQPKTIVHTRVHKEENDESISSSDDVPPTTQGEVESSFHITLCYKTPIEGENAEEAPHELEEGALLSDEDEETYITLLREYIDVFAWAYKEMPGLDPKVSVHRLAVKRGCRPVKRAHQRFRPVLIPSIEIEVNKLIEAGFIHEVKYPTWISSIVPVRKKNGQIHVCVDFWDLNVACPKDDFPLLITELMIDVVTGHEIMSFMDGSSGYNQIRMAPEDEELTTFRMPKGIYCYKVGLEKCRFISNLAGRCQHFSRLKKKGIPFIWDEACKNAFESIKSYLMKPHVRIAPVHGRPLILYISTQDSFVGALLAQENDKGKENALYYLSKMMTPNELKYSPTEKLCLALMLAIKKLKHYFEAHTIRLVSKANPVKYVMAKGQALPDFLVDHQIPAEWELSYDLPDEDVLVIEVLPPWKMYFDGASHREGAGVGIVFVTPEGAVLSYSFTLTEQCSNNVAEYQALILGLEIAANMKQLRINIYGDSKLTINQVLGLYEVKKVELVPYNNYGRILMQWLWDITIEHVPRKENKQADPLAALASTIAHPATRVQVCQRWIVLPTFNEDGSVDEIVELPTASVYDIGKDDWRQPLIDYIIDGKLPEDPRKRVDIKRRAPRFIYYKDTLYHRSFDRVFLRCLGEEEALQAMQEAHSGVSSLSISCKLYPSATGTLHPTIASWPFDAWGLDVVGSITLKSSAGHAYILAATDYFSKWAEVVALKKVKKENVADFLRIHIIYRFRIPRYILTDNGKPFDNKLMDKICKLFEFKQRNSSAYYAAANGLAEAFNKTLRYNDFELL
ncbi:PREDICTED: uncharacterized protein LOC109192688 [Ipomoea nil]|uniref:uncharacterized protein LOC109192688 n=1 Tax=Ipomoea nil TaxID=35883 RepID=UPI000901A454|nr:PREDICTED: uncharacterized protein LOC109192688 [Ipomoea nil]